MKYDPAFDMLFHELQLSRAVQDTYEAADSTDNILICFVHTILREFRLHDLPDQIIVQVDCDGHDII